MNELDPKIFYFELPLYTSIVIDDSNRIAFLELIDFQKRIDEYSPILKENTTYQIRSVMAMKSRGVQEQIDRRYSQIYSISGGLEHSEILCVRTNEIFYVVYYYDAKSKIFMKVGQYPSIADLHISKIKNYDIVLSKEKLKEFTRAIGLAANGVGIGSFVYLRRIFEDLIEEEHQIALKDGFPDNEEYLKSRMEEKIKYLKKYLPKFLVENKRLYGILSKGIHELTENDCLLYFDTVKIGIELILDEKVVKLDTEKKLIDVRKRIESLSSSLSKK